MKDTTEVKYGKKEKLGSGTSFVEEKNSNTFFSWL